MAILQDQTAALAAQIAKLQAENEALKAKALSRQTITLKVSAKGAVSVYGMGKWPVTLYGEQWLKLLAKADDIREFIVDHDDELSHKD